MRRSAAGWRFPSLRGGGRGKKETLNRPLGAWTHKRRPQVWRAYKNHVQYPWVLQGSQEGKCANLCSARGHIGAIITMEIAMANIAVHLILIEIKC